MCEGLQPQPQPKAAEADEPQATHLELFALKAFLMKVEPKMRVEK